MDALLEKAKQIREIMRESDNPAEIARVIDDNKELLFIETPFGSWLHVAASFGLTKTVQWLVNSGLDPNRKGGTLGGNALNLASSYGYLEIVGFLLEKGSELDTSEPERNPLFSAIYRGSPSIVQLLLDAGIDSNVHYTGENMKDIDAVAFAMERGEQECADLIAQYQAKGDAVLARQLIEKGKKIAMINNAKSKKS